MTDRDMCIALATRNKLTFRVTVARSSRLVIERAMLLAAKEWIEPDDLTLVRAST